MNKFQIARLKHKSNNIKYLLIAEAPPKEDSNRFFYFENVIKGDSLFLETMKVLYLGKNVYVPEIRNNKKKLLDRFKNNGFYLEDSMDEPIKSKSSKAKINEIWSHLPELINKLKKIVSIETKIILISATVYSACYSSLIKEGFNIINEHQIYFPGSGGQKKFRQEFSKLLKKQGFKTSI